MKIILKNNFDRETVSDVVICANINEKIGSSVVEFLNDNFSSPYSPNYFALVDDEYKLYEFNPNN